MKIKTWYFFCISIILLISCKLRYNKSSDIKFPSYQDSVKNTGVDFEVENMVMCHNDIQHIDTFNFSKQIIDLNKQPKRGEFQNYSFDNYIWPKDSIKIQILIDTTKIIATKNNRIFNIPQPSFILNENDSELTQDFNEWLNYYPVFILNKTDSIITLNYEEISGFKMIQEATDSLGNWKPIQYWHWNWCGNAYSSIELKSNHYALTRVPKFSGDFKTKLRLKLKYFNKSFYSQEFRGSINYSQFIFPKELDFYSEREIKQMLLIE